MINKKIFIILTALTIIGFILRFYHLSSVPPSLNWDEVSHGWNAYSILKTGRDEWGMKFPSIFRAFGDYKLPVYIYLTVIPVALFGLNLVSVRLISVLAGTLAIPLIYFLAKEFFKGPKTSSSADRALANPASHAGENRNPETRNYLPLLSAAFLTFLPWHIFISRVALEANLALTFIIAGSLFIIKGIKQDRYYLISAFFFGLSLHTYNTARVFVPLFLFLFILIFRKKFKLNRYALISVAIIFLSSALVIWQVFSGSGIARYDKLAILSESAVYQIGQQRLSSKLPPIVARVIYSKPVYFSLRFTENYLNFFTMGFFDQSKDPQIQFAIPNQNLITYPVLILFVIGLYDLIFIKKLNNRSTVERAIASPASHAGKIQKLLLIWLLLSPVAAATTEAPPQALRPNPLIPVIAIVAVFGFEHLLEFLKKYHPGFKSVNLTFLVMILTLLNLAIYLNQYFNVYPVKYSESWQYGNQQVMDYVKTHLSEYEKIIITKRYGEPHIFYAFYDRIDPWLMFPGNENIRFKQSDWFWTDRLGKVYFVNDWNIPDKVNINSLKLESGGVISTKKSLLITSPDHMPANLSRLETVNFLDGQPAYIIGAIP